MTKKASPPIDSLSFEQAIDELDQLVRKMESGELSLEDSVALFERGRALSAHCQALLDGAELRVNRLTEDGRLDPGS